MDSLRSSWFGWFSPHHETKEEVLQVVKCDLSGVEIPWPTLSILGLSVNLAHLLIFLCVLTLAHLYITIQNYQHTKRISLLLPSLATKADFATFMSDLSKLRTQAKADFISRLSTELDPFVNVQSSLKSSMQDLLNSTTKSSSSLHSALSNLTELTKTFEGLLIDVGARVHTAAEDQKRSLRDSFAFHFAEVNDRLASLHSIVEQQQSTRLPLPQPHTRQVGQVDLAAMLSSYQPNDGLTDKSLWEDSFVTAMEGYSSFKEPEEEKERKRKQSADMDKRMIETYKSILNGLASAGSSGSESGSGKDEDEDGTQEMELSFGDVDVKGGRGMRGETPIAVPGGLTN
ncbi:hypothetical protein BT69DRAFT_1278214 [Atractiella rhizophila]|nr:hypothetical protein BT69DRAFT_1278214 [Atractiella rhizophila]